MSVVDRGLRVKLLLVHIERDTEHILHGAGILVLAGNGELHVSKLRSDASDIQKIRAESLRIAGIHLVDLDVDPVASVRIGGIVGADLLLQRSGILELGVKLGIAVALLALLVLLDASVLRDLVVLRSSLEEIRLDIALVDAVDDGPALHSVGVDLIAVLRIESQIHELHAELAGSCLRRDVQRIRPISIACSAKDQGQSENSADQRLLSYFLHWCSFPFLCTKHYVNVRIYYNFFKKNFIPRSQ